MQLNDLILISVDDHIIEPPGLFDQHIPSQYADRCPRMVVDPKTGAQTWGWEGGQSATAFINAVITLPKHEWGFDPATIAEVRPGCWDVAERVRDMDRNGILASMCFPSFPTFSGRYFAAADDKDLAYASLQAYNDWAIDEWAGSHPGRFIPLALPAIWDPQRAADEVRRVAAKGCTAITFSEDPAELGFPNFHQGAWDPFFAACCDEGVTIAIHIAADAQGLPGHDACPMDARLTIPTWAAIPTLANWLWSPTLQRFPDLRIALSEGGTSWIPGFLDRMERHYENQRWTGADLGGKTPTEVFREHFLACFISDASGLLLRERIGIDNIAFETDYPHSDCIFPGAPEDLWEKFQIAGVTEDEAARIGHQNAARFLRFDPFAHTPRDQATVGALRARAGDVDTTTRSKAEYKASYEQRHGPMP
jgi:predicted TIM-barrel fold metal-dependent hydrolase